MAVDRIDIRGVSYSLTAKYTEKNFCDMWKRNRKLMATPMKDREAEMQKDWERLQKALPKKKEKKEEGVV